MNKAIKLKYSHEYQPPALQGDIANAASYLHILIS